MRRVSSIIQILQAELSQLCCPNSICVGDEVVVILYREWDCSKNGHESDGEGENDILYQITRLIEIQQFLPAEENSSLLGAYNVKSVNSESEKGQFFERRERIRNNVISSFGLTARTMRWENGEKVETTQNDGDDDDERKWHCCCMHVIVVN